MRPIDQETLCRWTDSLFLTVPRRRERGMLWWGMEMGMGRPGISHVAEGETLGKSLFVVSAEEVGEAGKHIWD